LLRAQQIDEARRRAGRCMAYVCLPHIAKPALGV
jgi:hypothetical protein